MIPHGRIFLALLVFVAPSGLAATIKNPYYPDPAWKLWATDPSPVTDPQLLAPGQVGVLSPPDAANQVYPDDSVTPGKFLEYRLTDWGGRKYFGNWDDVYFSWDNIGNNVPHSFINLSWSGNNGNAFNFPGRDIIMMGYGPIPMDVKKFGINFTSQSTSNMGHAKANDGNQVANIEQDFYFVNCLRAGPALDSYLDTDPVYMNDSYQALVPSFYNSIYASFSELQALVKLTIVGGYLPTTMKTELKRNGLFMATLLYIWKASLPFSVPYDSEVRHRVAYSSNGGNYLSSGNDNWHYYNDTDHMANMVAMAKGMTTVAPPIAVMRKVAVLSGTETYFLKTAALIQQASGQPAQVRVNVNDSFDLAGHSLSFKWTVLYGNKNTTVVNEGGGNYLITVPTDPNLPQGRTTLILVANNGTYDSNPAALNFYRANGARNQRPVISGVHNITIAPGGTVTMPLTGVDPEGYPVSFFKRSDQPGTISGTTYTWAVPPGTTPGQYPVAILASDGTTGTNSTQFIITVNGSAPPPPADAQPPTVPTALSFTQTTSNSLTLGWTASTDNVAVTGYQLDVALNSNFTSLVPGYSNRAIPAGTSFVIAGLNAGQTYYAHLRAGDAAGNISSNSNTASGSTLSAPPPPPPPPAPSAPLILGAPLGNISGNQAVISWNTNVVSNSITQWGATIAYGQQVTQASPVLAHQITLSNLSPGTTYHFRVQSSNSAGTTSSADQTFFTPPLLTPTPAIAIADFSAVRVYPNPYRNGKHQGIITFAGLPADARIRLYTVSGHLLKTLRASSSNVQWDLTNESGGRVASGLYLYVMDTPTLPKAVHGKVAIIQ